MSYTQPNYTQIPNALLDEHMADMKEAELKVTMAIARKTFGWHKQTDRLSITQLMDLTGLSRQGVLNGIEAGLNRGTIYREAVGQSFAYSLVVNEVDQSTDSTSQRSRPEPVNEVDQLPPPTSQRSRPTKEKDIKETIKEKECASHRTPASTSAATQSDTPRDFFLERMWWIVGVDWNTIPANKRGELNQAKGILTKAGYSADDLVEFWEKVWKKDFRWRDKRSRPTIQQLRLEIGKVKATDVIPTQDDDTLPEFDPQIWAEAAELAARLNV